MGIPKFFRWLVERYPCILEDVKPCEVYEYENFYLDMNGIIHNSAHPRTMEASFRIDEADIFKNIFHYIEVLFGIIRPSKLFYLAIDGVAPRAKMNEQRARRFRSAKHCKEILEENEKETDGSTPEGELMDYNCISPGTEFMERLQGAIQDFVAKKITQDQLWKRPNIVISGSDVAGEGEHKIMEYIRYLRSQDGYDPHTRHCLYGGDADLLVLALASHEPFFSVLKEQAKFSWKPDTRVVNPEYMDFELTHLSILRCYIGMEFDSIKEKLPFDFTLEGIIDDLVLLLIFVGNDFVPHLPNMLIATDSLSILFEMYKAVLPTLDGYINETGIINLKRLEKFFEKLSEYDEEMFTETYADLKYFESKTGRRMFPKVDEISDDETQKENKEGKRKNEELDELIEYSRVNYFSAGECDDENCEALEPEKDPSLIPDGLFFKEFQLQKNNYYLTKMEVHDLSPETLAKEVRLYVEALQWVLNYYYEGCISWTWYYPRHYSPYISDLKGFAQSGLPITFEPTEPLCPFQQLLNILPPYSKALLPEAFQDLLTSDSSPIKEFYPEDFKIDLNGKKNDWEGVTLIPFIDDERIVEAMKSKWSELSPSELERNKEKSSWLFEKATEPGGQTFQLSLISRHDIKKKQGKLVRGLHPKCNLDFYHGTFPSFYPKLPSSFALMKKGDVKIFENPTRRQTMIITLEPAEEDEFVVDKNKQTDEDRQKVLEKLMELYSAKNHVYLALPYVVPVRVVSLVTPNVILSRDHTNKIKPVENNELIFNTKLNGIQERYLQRFGVDCSNCNRILVYFNIWMGFRVRVTPQMNCVYETVWSKYAKVSFLDTLVIIDKPFRIPENPSITSYFAPGSQVFVVSDEGYYGSQAEILKIQNQRIYVDLYCKPELNIEAIQDQLMSLNTTYFGRNHCSQMLGISANLFSSLTGDILISCNKNDKINIGLNLKSNRYSTKVVSYTIKNGKYWEYSQKTIDLVGKYLKEYPEIVEAIEEILQKNDSYDELLKKFPEKIIEIAVWLSSLKLGERRPCSSECLNPEQIEALHSFVCSTDLNAIEKKPWIFKNGGDLMKALMVLNKWLPQDYVKYKLLDRVIFVRDCHHIPLGTKGTVIALTSKEGELAENEVVEVLMDMELDWGMKVEGCSKNSVVKLTAHSLINITAMSRKQMSPRGKMINSKYGEINSQQDQQYYSPNKISQGEKRSTMPASFRRSIGEEAVQDSPTDPESGPVSWFFKAYQTKQNDDQVYMMYAQNMLTSGEQGVQESYRTVRSVTPKKDSTQFISDVAAIKDKAGTVHNVSPRHSGRQRIAGGAQRQEQSLHQVNSPQTKTLKKLLRISEGKGDEETNMINKKNNNMVFDLNRLKTYLPETSQTGGSPQNTLPQCFRHRYCCSELISLCKLNGLGVPRYKHEELREGLIRCTIIMEEGWRVTGDVSNDKAVASARAACKTIDLIEQTQAQQKTGSPQRNTASVRMPTGPSQRPQQIPTMSFFPSNAPQEPPRPEIPKERNDFLPAWSKTFIPLQVAKKEALEKLMNEKQPPGSDSSQDWRKRIADGNEEKKKPPPVWQPPQRVTPQKTRESERSQAQGADTMNNSPSGRSDWRKRQAPKSRIAARFNQSPAN